MGLKQTHKSKQATHKNKRQTQTNGKYKIRQIITKTMEHTHTLTHTQNQKSPKKRKYKSDLVSK